jgi:hypothetical protein
MRVNNNEHDHRQQTTDVKRPSQRAPVEDSTEARWSARLTVVIGLCLMAAPFVLAYRHVVQALANDLIVAALVLAAWRRWPVGNPWRRAS